MEEASANIVAVAGFANIGETITCPNEPQALPLEPTLQMTFSVNDSPFADRKANCDITAGAIACSAN